MDKRGDRGAVCGFSRQSRKRLFEWLHTIDWKASGVPLFITLTYGQAFPSPMTAKRDLRAFCRSLNDAHGGKLAFLWRLEFQERGAPHFHLLVWGATYIASEACAIAWAASISRAHWDRSVEPERAPFTRVEAIRSERGVMWYVGKYLAKVNAGTASTEGGGATSPPPAGGGAAGGSHWFNSGTYLHKHTGRIWGVINRRALVRDRVRRLGAVEGGDEAMAVVKSLMAMKHKRGINAKTGGGFTVFYDERGIGNEAEFKSRFEKAIAAAERLCGGVSCRAAV